MLTQEQWDRIRESTDKVINNETNHNYRADEDGLPVKIMRLPDGTVQITLKQTKNWDIHSWERQQ